MHERPRSRLRAVLAGTALLLCACSDATGTDGGGSMKFDYAGDFSGSFSAAGKVERGTGRSYAVVYYDTSPNVTLAGYEPRDDGGGNRVFIVFPRPAGPGTYPIRNDLACPGGALPCASGYFMRDRGQGLGTLELVFMEGTLTVTSVSATEVSGTFSGLAQEEPTGLLPHPQPYVSTTITHGRFRAPLTELRFSSRAAAGADAPRLGTVSARPRR
jgi:hypothetical protein